MAGGVPLLHFHYLRGDVYKQLDMTWPTDCEPWSFSTWHDRHVASLGPLSTRVASPDPSRQNNRLMARPLILLDRTRWTNALSHKPRIQISECIKRWGLWWWTKLLTKVVFVFTTKHQTHLKLRGHDPVGFLLQIKRKEKRRLYRGRDRPTFFFFKSRMKHVTKGR